MTIDHLQALLAKGLTQEEETIARRYYSQKERDSMDASDFAGPHESFPIKTQQDVYNAAKLIGHADDPAAVKAAIKRIAKRKGFNLPDAWEEEDDGKQERAAASTTSDNHEPFTGKHSHGHGHMDGYDHEHEHEHNNDNLHDHPHTHEIRAADGAMQASDRHVMSLPLVRIDAAKREVWGQATAEVPDSYGTIFGYYPEAWKSWRGNIREQHDPKKAVGKRVELECNDLERSIWVGSRVSRGAPDTWAKVEDNVLTGYSASIIPDPEYGSDPKRWPRKEYDGKMYPYLPRYTIAELSLVDNPACPGCNIQIVRADGFATDVLDLTEEEPPVPEQQPLERAGARVSSDTRAAMHDGIGHTLKAAVSQMKNCNCPDCQAAMKMIDPDGDGDIDLGGYDDSDQDWQSLYSGTMTGGAETDRVLAGIIERVLEAKLSAVYSRLQGIAGTLARGNAQPSSIETIVTSAISRAVEAVYTTSEASLSEVRADLSAVKATVDRIESTPMPGAPIMNAGALPRPALPKQLPTDPIRDPYARPQSSGSAVADAMAQLSQAGHLNDFEKQMDAMTAGLILQKQQRGGR